VNVSRREFLKSSMMAPLCANFLIPTDRKEKPNLLFIWTDQQRPDTMAVYGNTKIHAPNLNRLAGESFVFERQYVTQPVCSPSRSSVMTGFWPHTNGCIENNVPLSEKAHCVPEILADTDYRTGYFGKWHLGDEVSEQHGFEEWESIEDIYGEYFRRGQDSSRKSSYSYFLMGMGYKPDKPDGSFSREFASKLPIRHCKPSFLESRTCDFLRRHRNEPFFLYVNFLEPHPPYFGPLDNEHRTDEVDLPINFADLLEDHEPLRYHLMRQRQRTSGNRGFDLESEPGWRRLITNYWGLVSQVDRSVGAILKTLEDLGLADNTIVFYTSDHGDMMGSHGMIQKSTMYEEAARVPLMIRLPQRGRRHRMVPGRFSHIDLVPTVLDLMGRKAAGSHLPGQSLLPFLKNDKLQRRPVHIEWNPALTSTADEFAGPKFATEPIQRAIRSHTRTVISQEGWKLCLSTGDKHQLFDFNKDPGETHNLYYTGRHREVVRELTKQIHSWQRQVKDSVEVEPGD
jgi:arylsulfatase A-like enzyme